MKKTSKAVKAVKAAAKSAGKAIVKAVNKVKASANDRIKLTAKTWKSDLTGVLISFAWAHEYTFADVLERITATDSEKHTVKKTGTVLFRVSKGSVARDVEYSTSGAMRIRNYGAGGTLTGWFKESDVAVAGMTVEHFANAEALAKTFKVAQMRKASGSSESYAVLMENDLSKAIYSASVRRLSSGKLIAWHEEDKRNVYNAHEISATERELARTAVLNGSGKRTVKAVASV
jgi:hypothetical protein